MSWGRASQRQSQDPPQATEAFQAPVTREAGARALLTALAVAAGWAGGRRQRRAPSRSQARNSPPRRPHILSAAILYLPSTFTFLTLLSKKHTYEKYSKENVYIRPGTQPQDP